MIAAMLTVIGGWILIFCLLAGIGQFVRRAFGLRSAPLSLSADFGGWFSAFWIGYAVAIAVLEGWHLLLPIDWRICLLLGLIGLIGFAWAIYPQRSLAEAVMRRISISRRTFLLYCLQIGVQIVVMIPITLWIASRALNAQVDFDTAMYHLSTIHWLNVYPVVPGIGNLHYRLAFNQSFFMFVAALNVYPFFGQGMHLGNSLLMIVLLAQVVNTTVSTLFFNTHARRELPYSLFSAFLLPILLYRAVYQYDSANMSSPSPDLSVFIFQIVVILAFNRWLFTRRLPENERHFTLFFVIALSAVGVTSKLSFVAFGLGVVGLMLLIWLWSQRHQRLFQATRQALTALIVVGACVILPWIGNGLISSGYPLFPSTFGALPVDYRVPASIAIDAADWVRSFARDPHGDIQKTINGWDWIPVWESGLNDNLKYFLFVQPFNWLEAALAAYAVLFVIIVLLLRRRYRFRAWLPLLPAILSAVFWFWSAPDPRFAGSAFWIITLWVVVLIFTLLPKGRGVVFLPLIPVLVASAVLVVNGLNSDFRTDGVGFPPLPTVSITQFKTNSGLLVNVAGNPNDTLELWDAPLPASPYQIPELELRGVDLTDGFRMGTPTVTP
jgi:hypothetical protein